MLSADLASVAVRQTASQHPKHSPNIPPGHRLGHNLSRQDMVRRVRLPTVTLFFEETAEQRELLGVLREYLQAKVAPSAASRDHSGEFPHAEVRALGEMGVMGAQTPEQYGGAALDTATFARIIEEVAAVDGSLALTVASHNSLAQGHLLVGGNPAQHAAYLPELASGQVLGAWGLTEPASGSDSGAMATTASEVPDGFVLNGSKIFITQGSVAGIYVINARTDPPRPNKSKTDGLSTFVFRHNAPGFSVGRKEDKLGLRSSDTAMIHFSDLFVPHDALVGVRGQGFKDVMRVLDGGRIGIAAMAVGLGRAALDVAANYSKERVQFGRAIADFQGIGFKLAEMSTELEAARLLYLKAAALKDANRPFTMAAAQAKLLASEVGVKACDHAIQILGGYGYSKEYPAERLWRDARLTRIGEGTSEIQHLIIARELLKQYE
jgi:alkylation response protein AidB-like acyl-CoA dehydrogenase